MGCTVSLYNAKNELIDNLSEEDIDRNSPRIVRMCKDLIELGKNEKSV